ncbi:MAG: putative motility protein [Planctomycetota bacterium]
MSGIDASSSVSASVLAAASSQGVKTTASLTALRTQLDEQESQGQAAVELIQASTPQPGASPPGVGQRLDVTG